MNDTRKQLRGLTLIELMVSMTLLIVILSVAVGLLVGAQTGVHRARVRAELSIQGEFFSRLMGQELRNAGVGVPPRVAAAAHVVDGYGGAGATFFDTYVILANATEVGFVGDFPRPDAQYNALGPLHNRPGGNTTSIMWHTENNGACAPGGTSTCTTATTSVFFPGEAGCTANATDRTCPWGMRRVIGGERLQVVAGNGTWDHTQAATTIAASNNTVGTETVRAFQLDSVDDLDAAWANNTTISLPTASRGQGWVTTIDRIFYFLDGTDVKRVQCRGDPDPQNANWPNIGTTTRPSTASLAFTPTGGAANVCIEEVVLKNVASFSLTYFAGAASTATKSAINRVDWVIKLSKSLEGMTIQQDVVGSAQLRAFNG